MGQVVYTGSISGNHNLNANGSDGVTVYLSRSGSFPSSYTVTRATLYLSKFYCYSTSKGIDLFLNGSRVNDSEMRGSEVTQRESGGNTSWYSISGTWNLSTSADYEEVSAAEIVSRAHSASSTGVMNLRDGCQVKITVEYSEDSGGNDGGGDSGGGNTGGGDDNDRVVICRNVRLSDTKSTGADVILSWEITRELSGISTVAVLKAFSKDGEKWEDVAGSIVNIIESAKVDSNTIPPIAYACAVTPPDTAGTYYRYRIFTYDSEHGALYSDYSEPLQRVRPLLESYTDDPLIAGETRVKAVHMLELQTNINRLREGERLPAYDFTAIVAGRTGLAGWSERIAELRAAIDETGLTHEAWIPLEINSPRADVLTQLRTVVAALW